MALVNNHNGTGSFTAATSGTVTLTNNANAIVVIDVLSVLMRKVHILMLPRLHLLIRLDGKSSLI